MAAKKLKRVQKEAREGRLSPLSCEWYRASSNDARREARFRDGELVLLSDQDRSLWDTAQIADGRAMLERALALHGRGLYVVQAIASLHADELRDFPQIAALYGELSRLTASPVVELDRAVAVARGGWSPGGARHRRSPPLEDYRYLHTTRGELLRRLGRKEEARDAYRRTLALVHDDAERRLLERRLAELGRATGPARQWRRGCASRTLTPCHWDQLPT